MRSYPVDEYQIGLVCALPKELKAVRAILDEEHERLKSQDKRDHNSYILGRVGKHKVVAAGLPAGVYGTSSAASVGRDMLRTFPQIRFGLLVGIAGGIPNLDAKRDIRLGDVVVGQPDSIHGGVVQYDLGKLLQDRQFVRKGTINKPPQTLLTALTNLQADLNDSLIARYVEEVDNKHCMLKDQGYCYQGSNQDQLHCAVCSPSEWWWILWLFVVWFWPLWRCDKCDNGLVIRPRRRFDNIPIIHYGTVASANTLLKNAVERDRLAKSLGALCVEMEAAGMDDYPCLVIRGICDYADAHKNDVWQEYAALTAAAFTKMLLSYVSPEATRREKPVQQVLDQLGQHFQRQHDHNTKIEEHNERREIYYHEQHYIECHRVFGITDYERQKNINADAVPGTCRWVLDHSQYTDWLKSTRSDLLWISADPGCGKSVLSKWLIDYWLPIQVQDTALRVSEGSYAICYFFFKDNEEQSRLSTALCAILHQLFSQQPGLIRHALPAFNKNRGENLIKQIDELWRILQSAMADEEARPVICVLDALDECSEADRQLVISLLCQSYEDAVLSSTSKGCLKWLVTGRPHDDIQGYFGWLPPDLPSIRLRGEDQNEQIGDEINLVIDQRMTDLGRQLRLPDSKREEIVKQLREMHNRTYLWLHLVLDSIEAMFRRSPRPNEVRVPMLPATVEQAYENILRRIVDDKEKQYAKVVFTIIVGAPRPLTVHEMALAFDVATSTAAPCSLADLTVDADGLGDKIRGWCGLFVFIKHNRLYLIHQTAKEFLLGHDEYSQLPSNSWKYCLQPSDIEKSMARIYIFFLCLCDFNRDTDDDDGTQIKIIRRTHFDTFFFLACKYWAAHVRSIHPDLDDQMQLKIDTLYDPQSQRFKRWARLAMTGFSRHYRKFPLTDIHLACHNGHTSVVRRIVSTDPSKVTHNVNKRNKYVDDIVPLSIAAQSGRKDTVEFLLSCPGIDVNQGASLSQAVANRHEEIVKLLLAHPEVDVNLREPLSRAVWIRHKELVKLFLEHPRVDVDLKELLSVAAMRGFPDMIETLLAQPKSDVGLQHSLASLEKEGYHEAVTLLSSYKRIT